MKKKKSLISVMTLLCIARFISSCFVVHAQTAVDAVVAVSRSEEIDKATSVVATWMPQWKEGDSWVVRVERKSMDNHIISSMAHIPDAEMPWIGSAIRFEVIGNEAYEEQPCFVVQATWRREYGNQNYSWCENTIYFRTTDLKILFVLSKRFERSDIDADVNTLLEERKGFYHALSGPTLSDDGMANLEFDWPSWPLPRAATEDIVVEEFPLRKLYSLYNTSVAVSTRKQHIRLPEDAVIGNWQSLVGNEQRDSMQQEFHMAGQQAGIEVVVETPHISVAQLWGNDLPWFLYSETREEGYTSGPTFRAWLLSYDQQNNNDNNTTHNNDIVNSK